MSGDKVLTAEERREAEVRLRAIPNVGPAMARDLLKLGITRLDDAAGRDPDDLYGALCALDGVRHDPCVRDVLAAVVAHANGEEARPWWAFTPERKARNGQSLTGINHQDCAGVPPGSALPLAGPSANEGPAGSRRSQGGSRSPLRHP